MAQSTPVLAARYFFVDLLGGILLFPLWWYTSGGLILFGWARASVRDSARALALGVWVRNLFVPMFGERGVEGKIISLCIRLAMIVLRGLAVGIWAALVAIVVCLYFVLPLIAVVGMVFHASALITL